jgi:hypothetical protein
MRVLFLVTVVYACQDGTASYPELLGSALDTAARTATQGAFIGWRSGRCDTPVTPAAITFNIWSFIYSQTSVLYSGILDDHARFHLSQANRKTSDWLQAFVTDINSAKAATLLNETGCHLNQVRHHVCATPSSFACCAASQYATWVSVASLLSDSISMRYGGGTCDDPVADVATVRASFGRAVGQKLDALAVDRSDKGRTMELTVWAWAYKGICRNDGCPDVTCDHCDDVLAAIKQLSAQSDVTFATSLACV